MRERSGPYILTCHYPGERFWWLDTAHSEERKPRLPHERLCMQPLCATWCHTIYCDAHYPRLERIESHTPKQEFDIVCKKFLNIFTAFDFYAGVRLVDSLGNGETIRHQRVKAMLLVLDFLSLHSQYLLQSRPQLMDQIRKKLKSTEWHDINHTCCDFGGTRECELQTRYAWVYDAEIEMPPSVESLN